MNEFMNYYLEEKESLEKDISSFNENLKKENDSYLKENLIYFANLNSSGKRIRGILVNLGYELKKEKSTYSHPLAVAYEVFQTAILVHDDIIDQDDKRRSLPTIHYLNRKKYENISSTEETNHFSNSIALCMGDYGLYLSNKLISDAYKEDNNLGNVLSYFNDTVLRTIKGELLDVILPFKSKNIGVEKKTLEEKILDIYRLKTSYYTFIGPLSVGLILAGASKDELNVIEEFGTKLGIAYQIQDDILGIYSKDMGKVQASDIKEYKQTLLYAYTIQTKYKEELDKVYGKNELDDYTIQEVQRIMRESEALEKATNLMNSLYDESLVIINDIDWIKEKDKNILKGFVDYLRNRNQ